MKILEEGIWLEFTCLVCKSKCQADPGDATSRSNKDSEGDTVGYIYTVECGKCGAYYDLPGTKITQKIKWIADAKRGNLRRS